MDGFTAPLAYFRQLIKISTSLVKRQLPVRLRDTLQRARLITNAGNLRTSRVATRSEDILSICDNLMCARTWNYGRAEEEYVYKTSIAFLPFSFSKT